jgi:nucleoside-diphosphate-sugar epimerase
MRYGVLHDIAECVLQGKAVEISTGCFNCIWQGDVAGYAIRSLLHCSTPPERINITGPESISVKWAAKEFGKRFQKPVSFVGEMPQSSLFSNSAKAMGLFGYPGVTLEQMIDWTSEWCLNNGEVISAPTHFEERNGRY